MRKIRSLNFNKKFLVGISFLSVGLLGSFLLDKKLEDIYADRKFELEETLGYFLDKDVELGNYEGLRVFGIGLSNLKIIGNENVNTKIAAKSLYVGIMPIRSFLNQKWIINVKPKGTTFNLNKDFLKREEAILEKTKLAINKEKYEVNLYLKEFSNLKIKDLDIESKIKGNFKYSSESKQISGLINSKFNNKDNLKLKFNTKLNQDSFSFQIISKGINLRNLNFNIYNRKIALKEGKLRSNFKFYRTPSTSYCKGNFSLNKLELRTTNLLENINSNYLRFFCENNNLIVKTDKLKYGTLISDFIFNVPLKNNSNNISLDGNIRYLENKKSVVTFSGDMPYWFDKRGLNFGEINSGFILNRSELANLNIFRKNGIRGFVTAKGFLKGNLNNPDFRVNFNVNYPYYKGIRIRETWLGDITNNNNGYKINIQSDSPIPSFLTLNLDSEIRLNNLIFSRIFNANKGTLNIIKNNEDFSWEATNLPLDELEFSRDDSKFDRISGTINGSGTISKDLSSYIGRLGWSFGKVRNLDFKTSYFDFEIKENQYYIDSFIVPDDGGIIKILFDSEKDKLLEIDFENVSTKWSILNAINTLNIEDNNLQPKGKADSLNFIKISNKDIKYLEQIKLIKEFKKNKIILDDSLGFEKYFRKFESRYNGNIVITGNNKSNYKINTEINGYIDLKTKGNPQNKKEYFSIDLNGGLFEGKGNLKINQVPLKSINIFLDDIKDFKGSVDLDLNYDPERKSFKTILSSKNTQINDYDLNLDKGEIEYNKNGKNRFDLDLSLIFKDKKNPIKVNGYVPVYKKDILDLKLEGKSEFLKLIDIFYGENINFKKGDVALDMRIRGPMNQPIFNADLKIKDSEIDIFKNNLKNINSEIKIIGDQIKINSFSAMGEKKGMISIGGNLPIYKEKISNEKFIRLFTDKFNLVSKNNNFILDSDINISGSFKQPTLSGNIALKDGFINIKNSNKKIYKNKKIYNKNKKNSLQDRFWNQDQDIEIISNEKGIELSKLLTQNLPEYFFNFNFKNLKLKLGPDLKLGYSNIISAYLETIPPLDLTINESFRDENIDNLPDLRILGIINLKKGRANLYTTPFKLDKNKNNFLLFAPRSGLFPLANFNLTAKVPDSIISISQNNKDDDISNNLKTNENKSGFGSFGIGNTRLIKIEASYYGKITNLSFEDENRMIQLRSTPSYNRSEIIGLIGGNSANLINRAFISQINGANAFSERFQLSLYPALITNNEPINNVFSNERIDIDSQDSTSNSGLSSQVWVAEIGLDITNSINFAVQATPDRDDLPPTGIITLQANPNTELLGSFDSNGDWKSQVQLFFRY